MERNTVTFTINAADEADLRSLAAEIATLSGSLRRKALLNSDWTAVADYCDRTRSLLDQMSEQLDAHFEANLVANVEGMLVLRRRS